MTTKSLITAPASEPISLAQAKQQIRIEASDTADDDLISEYITTAREDVEIIQNRQLITATWRLSMDEFPSEGVINFPVPPLQSVTSVEYYDEDGTSQTFDSSNYDVNTYSTPGKLRLKNTSSWPNIDDDRQNPINITFVAGYGDSSSDVPQLTRQSIRLMVAHKYEHRGDDASDYPMAVNVLAGSGRWGMK